MEPWDTLEQDQARRYARHILLPEIGGAGQQTLSNSTVVLVGLGGLGSPAALYLAGAGIGSLILVDADVVSLDNLQRQVIYTSADVGKKKVACAARALRLLNPQVAIGERDVMVRSNNVSEIISDADVVVEGVDTYHARVLIADACEAARTPLITASVGRFDGSVTTLKPWESDQDGRQRPRYRDLFPVAPGENDIPECARTGVLGPVVGVIGSMQAVETVKLLVGFGETLVGRLLLVDLMDFRFQVLNVSRVRISGRTEGPL